jgi:hypothetical protein
MSHVGFTAVEMLKTPGPQPDFDWKDPDWTCLGSPLKTAERFVVRNLQGDGALRDLPWGPGNRVAFD